MSWWTACGSKKSIRSGAYCMYNVDYNTCPGRRPSQSAATIHHYMPLPYMAVCHYRPLPLSLTTTLSSPLSGRISTELWTTSVHVLSGTIRNSCSAFECLAISADGGVGLLGRGHITDGVGRETGRSDERCGGSPELLDDRLCEDHGYDLTHYNVEGGGVSCSKRGSIRLFADCSDWLSMSKTTFASVHMPAHRAAQDAVLHSPSSTSCGAG